MSKIPALGTVETSRKERENTGTIHHNTDSTFRRFPVFSCRIQTVFLDLGERGHRFRIEPIVIRCFRDFTRLGGLTDN